MSKRVQACICSGKIATFAAVALAVILASASKLHASFTGWIVGSSGTLARSIDDGNTWTSFASNAGFSQGQGHFHPDLFAVSFPDPQNGWIAGAGGLVMHTANSGSTWTIQTTPTVQTIQKLQFVNALNGWAVGDNGTIIHTADGGAHWSAQVSGTGNGLGNLTFLDALNGWTVGGGGTVLHTVNGGATWSAQNSGTGNSLNSVAFADPLDGWVAGAGQLLIHTSDGGNSWQPQVGPYGPPNVGSNWLTGLYFKDALHGVIFASAGAGSTSDGGANWTPIATPENSLWRSSFPDLQNGWVSVVQDSNIIHTADGGNSWSVQNSFFAVTGAVNDITFFTAPEPSSCLLLLAAIPALLSRRRQRPRCLQTLEPSAPLNKNQIPAIL